MRRAIATFAVLAAFGAGAPVAFAQSAGDQQYQDPFANHGGGNSGSTHSGSGSHTTAGGGTSSGGGSGTSGGSGSTGSGTTAGTTGTGSSGSSGSGSSGTSSSSGSGTSARSGSKGNLPYTGLDAGIVGGVGALAALGGVAIRRVTRRDD